MTGSTTERRCFLVAGARVAGLTLLAGIPGLVAAPAQAACGRVVALAFASSLRTLFKASADAVYRSGDGGRNWTPVALPPAAVSRTLTSIALAAGGKGALYIAGRGLGVVRSDDGGRHWSVRTKGLPDNDVAALATHADRPGTLYAYLAGRGIFRSEDGGRRWRLMDAGPRGGITRLVHSNMPGSMQSGWLFAAAPQGVQRSMDCFCGWHDAGELGRTVRAVAYDPRQPRTVYAATDAGLFSSSDGGETWSSANAPAANVEALAVAPDGALYAGGADGSVFRRNGAATAWERLNA
jgi:photosystem II stability/assembly factor-like uncharacterized protein